METEIQVKPMVVPLPENVKVNKTILVYDLPAGDYYIITLPVWGYANIYINWGDGEETQIITDETDSDNFPSKNLAGGRKYTIKIWGKIWRYGEYGVDSNQYLIEVKKIGPLDLTYAFAQASNLIKVPKHLPKGVTTLTSIFSYCSQFNYPINTWDVSHVTEMSRMFNYDTNFNQPIDTWDVSSVEYMRSMFKDAINFNQPLNNWNIKSVTNMEKMFYNASSFNQPLNNWNIENVKYMFQMFYQASSFNQPLNNWNIEGVQIMYGMFGNATSFNQSLNNWVLSALNKNLRYMFSGATSFNQPLNNWNVSNVTDMSNMFDKAISFNQLLNNWNVSSVENMENMFENATSFNQPLNNWNVSTVTNMANMFENAISFNQPLHNWNWTNISSTNMTSMLDYCGMSQYNFQLTLVGWYNIFSTLPIPETSKHFGAKGLVYNPARIIVDLVEDTPVYANDNSWFVADNAIAVNFDL